MPAWWDKLSGRSRDSDTKSQGSSLKNQRKNRKGNRNYKDESKANSFDDEVFLQQPRDLGREVSPNNSTGFLGFDSASSLDRGLPLPRPVDEPVHVHGVGFGSGSGSGSSVSSSGSFDDHPNLTFDHAPPIRLL